MQGIKQENRLAGMIIVLAGCLLLFLAPVVAAQDSISAMSADETLLIQGTVRRVLLKEKTISVKVDKGKKIQILVGQLTGFVGISSLEELKKGQRVKVWYTVVGEENRAVKVEKLLELGC